MTRLTLALIASLTLAACTDTGPTDSGDDDSMVDVDGGSMTMDGGTGGTDGAGDSCPATSSLCSTIARQDDITGTVDEAKAQAWADTYLADQCMLAACSLANGDFWSKRLCGPVAPVASSCEPLCDAVVQPDGTASNTAAVAWAHQFLAGQCLAATCPLPDGTTWTKNLCGPAGW